MYTVIDLREWFECATEMNRELSSWEEELRLQAEKDSSFEG